MEFWSAGLGDCTAEAPKDGSGTVFKSEALRAQTKEFLLKDSPNSVKSKIESFPACANFLTVIHHKRSADNSLRAWYAEAMERPAGH
jgi:hypothetical protein